jgi:hypothetical protein
LIIACPSRNGAVDKEFLAAMRGKFGNCENALVTCFRNPMNKSATLFRHSRESGNPEGL